MTCVPVLASDADTVIKSADVCLKFRSIIAAGKAYKGSRRVMMRYSSSFTLGNVFCRSTRSACFLHNFRRFRGKFNTMPMPFRRSLLAFPIRLRLVGAEGLPAAQSPYSPGTTLLCRCEFVRMRHCHRKPDQ